MKNTTRVSKLVADLNPDFGLQDEYLGLEEVLTAIEPKYFEFEIELERPPKLGGELIATFTEKDTRERFIWRIQKGLYQQPEKTINWLISKLENN